LGACSHVPPLRSGSPAGRNQGQHDDRFGSPLLARRYRNHAGGRLYPGLEIEYDRGVGQSSQHLGANEFIQLDGKTQFGQQDVRHHADLKYGHLAIDVICVSP